MRRRRNARITPAEKRALMSVLFKHNPKRRAKRKVRKVKLSKLARRRIALRNLRKARRHVRRSKRSTKALRRWATSQLGKHQTGSRGYAIVRSFRVRPRRGKKIKLPGLGWTGRKGTVKFSGSHHDPDFYGGSYEEFPVKFTNPRQVIRRRGKRIVVITNRRGRKVAQFKIRSRPARKHAVPRRLKKFLFKAGTARLKRIQAKARRGWAIWRRRQLAKRR